MSAQNMNKPSKTNWARIDAMTDEMIDTSDIPPLDESFFAKAKLRIPPQKVPITMNVDADVLDWFKAQGKEYKDRINAALRIYAEAHKDLKS